MPLCFWGGPREEGDRWIGACRGAERTGLWGQWGLRFESQPPQASAAPSSLRRVVGAIGWGPRMLDLELRQQRWLLVPVRESRLLRGKLLSLSPEAVWKLCRSLSVEVAAVATPCGAG
eukprot:Hpha_TRINITY_DN5355_c0_g1::TRINITY_DN5355_c0_g1_i1::g.32875::m.32875/K07735/algH; putative transcriptional regulator